MFLRHSKRNRTFGGRQVDHIRRHLEARGYNDRDPLFRDLAAVDSALHRLRFTTLKTSIGANDSGPTWAEIELRKDQE